MVQSPQEAQQALFGAPSSPTIAPPLEGPAPRLRVTAASVGDESVVTGGRQGFGTDLTLGGMGDTSYNTGFPSSGGGAGGGSSSTVDFESLPNIRDVGRPSAGAGLAIDTRYREPDSGYAMGESTQQTRTAAPSIYNDPYAEYAAGISGQIRDENSYNAPRPSAPASTLTYADMIADLNARNAATGRGATNRYGTMAEEAQASRTMAERLAAMGYRPGELRGAVSVDNVEQALNAAREADAFAQLNQGVTSTRSPYATPNQAYNSYGAAASAQQGLVRPESSYGQQYQQLSDADYFDYLRRNNLPIPARLQQYQYEYGITPGRSSSPDPISDPTLDAGARRAGYGWSDPVQKAYEDMLAARRYDLNAGSDMAAAQSRSVYSPSAGADMAAAQGFRSGLTEDTSFDDFFRAADEANGVDSTSGGGLLSRLTSMAEQARLLSAGSDMANAQGGTSGGGLLDMLTRAAEKAREAAAGGTSGTGGTGDAGGTGGTGGGDVAFDPSSIYTQAQLLNTAGSLLGNRSNDFGGGAPGSAPASAQLSNLSGLSGQYNINSQGYANPYESIASSSALSTSAAGADGNSGITVGSRPTDTLTTALTQAYRDRIGADDPILASQIADQQQRQQDEENSLIEQLSRYGVLRGGGDTAAVLSRLSEGNERNRLALEAASAQRRQQDLRDASAYDQAINQMDISQRGQALQEQLGNQSALNQILSRDVQRAGLTGQFDGQDTLAAQQLSQQMSLADRGQALQERLGGQSILGSQLSRDLAMAGDQRAQQAAESALFGQVATGASSPLTTLEGQRALSDLDTAGLAREATTAGLTGTFRGTDTAAERALQSQLNTQDLQRRLNESTVTGSYGGDSTIQAQTLENELQNQALNRALSRAGATGLFREEGDTSAGAETLESRLRTAGLTGELGGDLTLGGRQSELDLIGAIIAARDPSLKGRADDLATNLEAISRFPLGQKSDPIDDPITETLRRFLGDDAARIVDFFGAATPVGVSGQEGDINTAWKQFYDSGQILPGNYTIKGGIARDLSGNVVARFNSDTGVWERA